MDGCRFLFVQNYCKTSTGDESHVDTSIAASDEFSPDMVNVVFTPIYNGVVSARFFGGKEDFGRGCITYPRGCAINPRGWETYPRGWQINPRGCDIYPRGWETYPCGWQINPHGYDTYSRGWVKYPRGYVTYPAGFSINYITNQCILTKIE